MLRRLAPLLLPLGLAAQQVRLCERIEAPMAYVTMEVAEASRSANPLAMLMGSSALGALATDPAAAAAFGFVQSAVDRAAGEIELAVLGVLPAGVTGGNGMPLVVVRTRLSSADAQRMRQLLAEGAIAKPLRIAHGQQIYALAEDSSAARRPGSQLEAAIVGDDLVAANNAAGIDQALDNGTSATRRGIAGDERYRRLMGRLSAPTGALVVFADWRRLGARAGAAAGLGSSLLRWSGFGEVDAIAAAIAPRRDGAETTFASTVLLSFQKAAPIDGWLGTIEPAPARQLADDLLTGGLGGMVFAVDPARIMDHAAGPGGFCAHICGACSDCGLDPARVVRRLGRRGALQLMLLSGATATVVPAFALQAQSRKAAIDLVEEIARQVGGGARVPDRGSPHVDLRDVAGLERLRLGVVDDLLVFSQEAEEVAALAAARRERGRQRSQLEAALTAVLRTFARERSDLVAGWFHFDVTPWLEAVVDRDRTRSELPARHTGLIDVERSAAETVVRLQLLSAR